jgi:hypothetical protein
MVLQRPVELAGVIVMWESRDCQMKDGKVIKAIAFFDTRGFDEFWTRVSPGPLRQLSRVTKDFRY